MQETNELDKVFTVYYTGRSVELYPDCYHYPQNRILCVCRSYEVAQDFAMFIACKNKIRFQDYVVGA